MMSAVLREDPPFSIVHHQSARPSVACEAIQDATRELFLLQDLELSLQA